MKKTALIAALALCAVTSTAFADTITFPDVPADNWAYASVCELAQDGTVNGRLDGTFDPNATVTRAEFSKMAGTYDIYKTDKQANNLNNGTAYITTETPMYTDVEADAWYTKFANDSGLDKDLNGNFRPNDAATREDALTVLYKRAGSPKDCTAPESITSQGDAAMCAWGYETGIMTGSGDGNLRLSETITRAEASALIVRARRIVKAYGTYALEEKSTDNDKTEYGVVYKKNSELSGITVNSAAYVVSADDRNANGDGLYTYAHNKVSGQLLTDASAYPTDCYENYPYLLADVPSAVYTSEYTDIDGANKTPFELYYAQSQTPLKFADMYLLVLEDYITRVEKESGVKLEITYYPSLVWNNEGKYYVMRVQVKVLDTQGKTLTYKDVFKEENDTVLTNGYTFWTDVVTDYAFGLGIGGLFGFGNAIQIQ